MLYNYSTEKLIGLQDFEITNIEKNEKEIHIFGNKNRAITLREAIAP